MDTKLATRLLWGIAALWLIIGTGVVALAGDGKPLLPPATNMVMFAGLSTATVCLLIIRSHYGLAGRLDRLRERQETMAERLDHRDAAIYRDFIRRLDRMQEWMMRPAIPRGRVRVSATAAAQSLDEPTSPLSIVGDEGEVREMQAEVIDLGGRIARRIVDEAN